MDQKVRAKDQLIASIRKDACHLMNVLERLQACGYTTSECDGLTCGTVVSMTAQDHSGTTRPTVELAAGGCAKTLAAPKVNHSNKSSGSRHECTPSGRHSSSRIPVAQKGQHDSNGLLTVRYGELAPSALTSDADHVRDRALLLTRGGTS